MIFRRNENVEQTPRRRFGCLRGCLISLAIYFGLCALGGILFGSMFEESATRLEDNSVYCLRLNGQLMEQAPMDNPWEELLTSMPGYETQAVLGLDDIISNIRLAKTNDKIKGIYLYDGRLAMGQASAKAIRDALLDFKTSGKWIIAYSQHYGQSNYYIASVADQVLVNPVGTLAWHGLSAQKMYYTRLLEKVGVEMQIVKVGTFKSAVEPYFRTSMSEADKMQTELYVQGLWNVMREGVAQSRHLDELYLDTLADRYMDLQPADEYVRCGLADGLAYTEDVDSILRAWTGTKDYKLVSHRAMNGVERVKSGVKDKVAILYAEGNITDEMGDGIVGKKMVNTIRKMYKDEHVKAVVLRVNSGGGSADASEQIWHAMTTLQQKGLPVVVSMGDYAASGGYYISCEADYIYAEPNTITGSIGIFGTIPNLKKIREKVGIDVDAVNTHEHAGLESNMLYEGMNASERQIMQNMVERGYDLFTSRCAEGRHMSQEAIKAIGEGRVWLATDAMKIGLVDGLGNLDDAVLKAAELAGIDSYTIAAYPEKKDFLTELLESLEQTDSEEERIVAKIKAFASQPRVMAQMEPVQIQ